MYFNTSLDMTIDWNQTPDTQLDNLNKQKQDLEKQISDLKGQVLDEQEKQLQLNKLEEEKKKIEDQILQLSQQEQSDLKQSVEQSNNSHSQTFEIIQETWLYTELKKTFEDKSIYLDLNWNIEAKIDRFSNQINTTVQKYLESIFSIWEKQFPPAALQSINTWIQFMLMDGLKNSNNNASFFSSIGNVDLSWFKSLFDWLVKTFAKSWEFLSTWKKITKTIDFLSLQPTLWDNADKIPLLMNPYKFIQLVNNQKLQWAADITKLSLSDLSIQEWDTNMTQIEKDALKKIAENSAIKNDPKTINAIIWALGKADWFLDKRKDLANGALDLMDKANWVFAPFEKLLWVNMFDMLKPFKWVLNMILSLLWFSWWLDGLHRKRLSRKIKWQLDTQSKKDFIADSMDYFKDNITQSSVKESDSDSILTLFSTEIWTLSDDIQSKIPLDYNLICDSIKNNLTDLEIINPSLLQEMWSPWNAMLLPVLDSNWAKTYKLDKAQFAWKETEFIQSYTNLAIPKLIKDAEFMKDIQWQDEFWLAIMGWIVVDSQTIIDWVQTKAITPSQYLPVATVTEKPKIENPTDQKETQTIDQIKLLDNTQKELEKYNSPILAQEVINTSTKYNVPVEYIMAFMKNDSSYGTAWKWADTRNPWNVWNTDDGSTKRFNTRQEWVDAVWENLKYRIDEFQNVYWKNKFPTTKELADNVWPDGKWFLSKQWNYLKDNKARLWAYMTAPNWWNSVENISQDLASSWISNKSQFEQVA